MTPLPASSTVALVDGEQREGYLWWRAVGKKARRLYSTWVATFLKRTRLASSASPVQVDAPPDKLLVHLHVERLGIQDARHLYYAVR